jgi:hypothetical protein
VATAVRSTNKSPNRKIEPKIHPWFENHRCPVKIRRSDGTEVQMKMLRDSGSLQYLLSREHVNESCYTETGETRLPCSVGGVIEVPLVEVHLKSKYGTGTYLLGLVNTLPDPSSCGLIGNDLDRPVNSELVDCAPVGAVTRALTAELRQTILDHACNRANS